MDIFLKNNLYFKDKFRKYYQERNYEKNDVISYQLGKERPDKIFIVIQGLVLVETRFGQNNIPFYSFIGKNRIFGWEMLEVTHTAIAQEKTSLIEIERDFFFDHLYISAELYHKFLSNVVEDFFLLAESYQYINKSPIAKLLNSLLNLSYKMQIKPDENGFITFPKYVTPTFISKYARSSEPNISNAGSFLEKEKIIKRNPYRIINQEKAKKFLQEEYS